jgi:NAD+ synthase (glutamine-hydrolysing)
MAPGRYTRGENLVRVLRVGLAQINPTVGDLEGNVAKILEHAERGRELGVDLLCFPELAITGYPPEDLLLRRRFIDDNLRALEKVTAASSGLTLVVGFVDQDDDIYNAAAVVHDGRLAGVYRKQYLPNYGVFDENRYFQAGRESPVFRVAGANVGLTISEDIWYPGDPARSEAFGGAEVIITITASPFHAGKRQFRERMLSTRASDNAVFLCYLNPVGGQDELVFDGGSMVFNPRGDLLARCRQFEEELLVCDLNLEEVRETRLHDPRRRKDKLAAGASGLSPIIEVSQERAPGERPPLSPSENAPLDPLAEVYAALVLGTRDYVRKNGFEKVLVGLSGGIDSSLVAVIAADALGIENVVGVSMPSRYSSEGSRTDAAALARNLGLRLLSIPIEGAFTASLQTLAEAFADTEAGVAEENLQARIRGNILMALSNKFGWLVLTTGNKSEMATGYSTLYGDMAGGFAVLKDVPKTLVYELARYRNPPEAGGGAPVIPQSVIDKPPSAELRPDQLDVDSLPPYEVLDPILLAYVEEDRSLEEIVAQGFDEATVRRVMTMVDRNEYKRRQAPPGVKITPRAFGRDRRLPIANRYRSY